jgi:zinc transport system ATP-binding protein
VDLTPLVSIRDVDFSYAGEGATAALSRISLDVVAGTTVGLIGPNGGGKTTLVRLLLGQITPDRGTITVAGLTPLEAVRRGNIIGYLPQSLRVKSSLPLTVRQVIELGLTGKAGLLGEPGREDLAFITQLMDRLELSTMGGRLVRELSGGQWQRVLIARALSARPQLLLLDEPTTGIDRKNQQRFITLLSELKAELGLTLVFVSHDLRAVTGISDRLACLNVTLHYHDVPQRLPSRVASDLFACDLEAMGIVHDQVFHPPVQLGLPARKAPPTGAS